LGGIAQKAPALTTLLVIIALANIALPLTNSFVGEFLLFNGIWHAYSVYNMVFTALAGLSIILAAVYTLNMIQKICYGATNAVTETGRDINLNEKLALGIIVLVIVILGVYPQPVLNLTNGFVDGLMEKIKVTHL
jgi:NADH-quinone oxidoreductase subunit M